MITLLAWLTGMDGQDLLIVLGLLALMASVLLTYTMMTCSKRREDSWKRINRASGPTQGAEWDAKGEGNDE